MRESRNFFVALLASAFVFAAPDSIAQAVDCRSCHALGGAPGAVDLSAMYANPETHHPIGAPYPLGKPGFAMPDGLDVDVTYFDRNHNGLLDEDEIQLFDAAPLMAAVECATCHSEHGYGPPVPGHPPKYLRFRNTGSSLCTTCHVM